MEEQIKFDITYVALKLTRIIMFILVGVFGMSSKLAESAAWEIAALLISGGIMIFTSVWSWKHDKKLQASEPPNK